MSPRGRAEPPAVVERLVPDVFVGSHSPMLSTFLRGLTTGALVGAAIAGSALWSRYRRGRRPEVATAAEASPTDGAIQATE
jgi:hypothetical protein